MKSSKHARPASHHRLSPFFSLSRRDDHIDDHVRRIGTAAIKIGRGLPSRRFPWLPEGKAEGKPPKKKGMARLRSVPMQPAIMDLRAEFRPVDFRPRPLECIHVPHVAIDTSLVMLSTSYQVQL